MESYRAANIAIGAAYYLWPLTSLVLFVVMRKRGKRIPFPSLFAIANVYVVACGTGHFLAAAMVGWPAYRLEVAMAWLTAVVSIASWLILVSRLPRILAWLQR